MATRWGILSAGRISHDFVCALKTLPTEEHVVVAVAARDLTGAEKFAKEHNIPKALDSYEALAKLPEVDIVYIGTINTMHYETSLLMLNNGKHVLCEKPLTMNSRQTTDLLKQAKEKNLFFMEAVWSRCFPVYKKLREIIDNGEIGEPLHVNVTFGFHLEHVSRVNSKEMGGGVILDIGIYTLQFTQHVFAGLKPTKIVGSGNLNKSGVDDTAAAILHYPGNKTAVLSIGAHAEYPNTAVVIGTKGTLTIPQFWCPERIIAPTGTFVFELPKSDDKFNFNNSVGLRYEAEECRRCIKEKLLESPYVSHADSIERAGLMDAWRQQVGVVYNEDL